MKVLFEQAELAYAAFHLSTPPIPLDLQLLISRIRDGAAIEDFRFDRFSGSGESGLIAVGLRILGLIRLLAAENIPNTRCELSRI